MDAELKRALREDERQEKLLAEAIRTLGLLDPVRRRSLYRHLMEQIKADTSEIKPTSEKPKPVAQKNEATSFADRAEAFVLASKKGVTTRQVSDHIGQNYGSTDSTLRYIMKRGTIARRDNLWVSSGARGSARPMTLAEAVTAAFEQVNNRPMAAKEIFGGVHELMPTAKKPSVDATLVYMRRSGALVQKGDAPHGGGLYCLAKFGGAQAAAAN